MNHQPTTYKSDHTTKGYKSFPAFIFSPVTSAVVSVEPENIFKMKITVIALQNGQKIKLFIQIKHLQAFIVLASCLLMTFLISETESAPAPSPTIVLTAEGLILAKLLGIAGLKGK